MPSCRRASAFLLIRELTTFLSTLRRRSEMLNRTPTGPFILALPPFA